MGRKMANEKGKRCALCGDRGEETSLTNIGGVLAQFGPLLGPFQKDTYVHRLCALWSPEVYQEENKMRNVIAAVRRGRSLRCSYCNKKGATVGCCIDWCPKTYHIRCAQKAGCEINALEWILSCPEHSRRKARSQTKKPQRQLSFHNEPVSTHNATELLHSRKRSRDYLTNLNLRLNQFSHQVDIDEEAFQRKQQYRIQRDIQSLKPRFLGSSNKESERGDDPIAIDEFTAGWESVGGHEEVIRALKEAVLLPLMYQNEFKNLQLSCPKGILLHGEPGTGKTMVVRALAGACNKSKHVKKISFFSRKGADCLGKFHGEAERKLRLLFQEAEKAAPAIIFFDELDGLAPVRGGKVSDQIHSSVVSTLLSLMDGLVDRGQVVVIAATNRPESIDPALRRPGRFDREIYFPLPNAKQRMQILNVYTNKWSPKPSQEIIETIGVLTEGYAGADLKSLCTNAALACIKRHVPTILDNIDNGDREQRPLPGIESLCIEDRDLIFALERMSNASSQRSISGLLKKDSCKTAPLFLLPAIWKQLYHSLNILFPKLSQELKAYTNGAEEVQPERVQAFLKDSGLFSKKMLIGPHGVKTMGKLSFENRFKDSPPNLNLLVTGNASSSKILVEALMGSLGDCAIHKISLEQAIYEGQHSLNQGIIALTKRVFTTSNPGKIVIYCPNLQNWLCGASVSDEFDQMSNNGPGHNLDESEQDDLTLWNAFVDTLGLMPPNMKVTIIATCNLPLERIPQKIKDAFSNDVISGKAQERIIETVDVSENDFENMSHLAANLIVSSAKYLMEAVSSIGVDSCNTMRESAMKIDPANDVETTGQETSNNCEMNSEEVKAESAAEDRKFECCVSFKPTANVKCSSIDCNIHITSKYLNFVKSSSPWTCSSCEMKKSFSSVTLSTVLDMEKKVIQWLGTTLLRDHRCSVASNIPTNNDEMLDFVTIAGYACKGKYTSLSNFLTAAKFAMDNVNKYQNMVDRHASRSGSRASYRVSTSAACAVMDKIEFECSKFRKYVILKKKDSNTREQIEDTNTMDDSPQGSALASTVKSAPSRSLHPQIYEWNNQCQEHEKEMIQQIVDCFVKAREQLLDAKVFEDTVFKIMSIFFNEIQSSDKAVGGNAILLNIVESCLGA